MRKAGVREAGAATILVLIAAGVVATAAGVSVAVGTVVVARHRAALAADAAALAAAARVVAGGEAGCAVAADVARRNGATLLRCTVAGAEVEVVTRVRPPAWLAWTGTARGRARAGPADISGGTPRKGRAS